MDALADYLNRYRSTEQVRLDRAVLLRLLRANELELAAAVEADAARRLAEEARSARED